MSEIKTNDYIDLHEQIAHLTVILYDQYSLPEIQELINQQILIEDSLLLYRNKKYHRYPTKQSAQQFNHKSKNEDMYEQIIDKKLSPYVCNIDGYFYLIVQTNQSNNSQQFHIIDRAIGLANIIIAVQVDRQKQIYLERKYIEMINYQLMQQKQTEFISNNNTSFRKPINSSAEQIMQLSKVQSLYFVNSSYKKTYVHKHQQIYYCKKILQLQSLFANKYQEISQRIRDPVKQNQLPNLTINRIDPNSSNFCQQNKLGKIVITVKQLLNIFLKSKTLNVSTFQVKQTIMNYKKLIKSQQFLINTQAMAFNLNVDDCDSWKHEKQIEKLNVLSNQKEKLFWKFRQLNRYKHLISEEQANRQLIVKYKSQPIFQLSQDIINLQLQQFHDRWVQETLLQLKISFNLIANRRDTKAIDYFRQLCEKTRYKIKLCLQSSNLEHHNKQLLQKIEKMIIDFIEYHEAVIRQDYFYSGVQFYRKQIGFLWRNQRKIYERLGLFIGLIILASLQDNIILGLSIVALGFIFSAVNI